MMIMEEKWKPKKVLLHPIASRHLLMKKNAFFQTNKTLVKMNIHHINLHPHKMPATAQHQIA